MQIETKHNIVYICKGKFIGNNEAQKLVKHTWESNPGFWIVSPEC